LILLVGDWYVVFEAAENWVGPVYAGSAFTFVRVPGWVGVLVGHWTLNDCAPAAAVESPITASKTVPMNLVVMRSPPPRCRNSWGTCRFAVVS
jgi:hypothetical protein